ncbi:MAG: ParB family chromosome partitioning protein [Ignavibacteria bacterium]|nr:MAG: ParB family chromosome partitioning protein [Ignavibacteria bacterium]KAF0162072.1 MAG: ParB family chromosome partitioning protein [Ignavibacteria bacterium]
MNLIKPGLGRGLEALINPKIKDKIDAPIAVSSNELPKDDGASLDVLAKIDVDKIAPNPYQPRMEFDSTPLEELKKSILENGLIQPITVRRTQSNSYELISGERRLRSCKEIGIREIPAYIIKVDTKEAMIALALIENIQREKLNAIEIANAYKRLMEECNLTQEEIADKVGKDRTTVTNFIRLLKLPQKIQQSLAKDEITTGHARALINLNNEILQINLLEKIIKHSLSVRKVEEAVRKTFAPSKKQKLSTSSTNGRINDVSKKEIEEKMQRLLGTKVMFKQDKSGAGEIIIEFYSTEELERLYELIETIGRGYN